MAHVAKWKKEIVNELINFINKYNVIGIVKINDMPTLQFNRLRSILKDNVVIKVAKKNLIKAAIQESKKPNLENLLDYFDGMIGIIFTNENPFKLANILQKNKSPAPAKAGQIAPKDIVVKEGLTSFVPGPIINELSRVGIKAGVDKGKVKIMSDSIVAKEGDVITPELASVLSRLDIEPMEIGLDLRAVYEDGIIYDSKILNIDPSNYINQIKDAYKDAYALSLGIAYPTKENIKDLIKNAFNDAKNLSISREIYADQLTKDFIILAYRRANALKGLIQEG